MLNACVLLGNLGADPELFYSTNGSPVASFPLAFQSAKDRTGWIKVTCFGSLAEVAQQYLHKGARIGVSGSLDQQKWQTDEGENRSSFRLIARSIDFVKTNGQGFQDNQPNLVSEGPENLPSDSEELPF